MKRATMIVEFEDENGNVEVGTIQRFLDTTTSIDNTSGTAYEGVISVEVLLPCNFSPKIMRLPNGAEYYVVIDSVVYAGPVCIVRLRGEPNSESSTLWW